MKKTLITAVALAACAGTQLFAQNAKVGVITFALTGQYQNSVSVSTAPNAGTWSALPGYYKTSSSKVATADILKAIGIVVHNNAGFYSSKAQLVLVQGELSGFFNLYPELANVGDAGTGAPFSIQSDNATSFTETTPPGGGTFVALATGRHFLPNPTVALPASGLWPPGHHQPWGQIFVQDPGRAGFSVADPLCENVTFFFSITVEECYDCFYLNSFITDTTFKFKAINQNGPPCCNTPSELQGNGKDRYYMTLSFDNTENNPYLNSAAGNAGYIGAYGQNTDLTAVDYNPYFGIKGVSTASLVADGISADLLPYVDNISSGIGRPSPYEMRFTLNGIVTYTWALKLINQSDVALDFLGSASYAANGYGFIALRCGYLTGTATIAEKTLAASNCCLGGMLKDGLWYDWWYGTGWNQAQSPWDTFSAGVPTGFGSPINMAADLSFHLGFSEEYEPGEQWDTNPKADVPQPTPLDLANPNNFVPVGR